MNRRFKKPIALFTSLAALSATALVMFTVPAGATTAQTGCEASGCSVGGETATTPNATTGEALGVQFTLSDGGTINSACYPAAADIANYPSETGNDPITITGVGNSFTETATPSGGTGCVSFPHVNQSAGTTFIASYVDPFGHVNDIGSGPPAGSIGDVTGIVPTVNGGNSSPTGFGVEAYVYSDPLAPSPVSVTPTSPTTATFHFEGDNIGGGTTPYTCSQSVGGAVTALPVSPGTSGINNVLLTGLTPGPSNKVTCTVNEIYGSSIGPPTTAFTFMPPPPSITSITPETPTTASVAFGPVTAGATYTVTCTPVPPAVGSTGTGTGTTSPILVTGLTPNIAYSCTVTATFLIGPPVTSAPVPTFVTSTSGPGCKSSSVTAPVVLSEATGEKSAVVSWKQGVVVPDSCYVGSLITPSGSGSPYFLLGHGSTTVIYGLTDGAQVSFTVAVVTGSGVGPASVATAPITIGAPAKVRTAVASNAGKGSIKVSFKAGKDNGAAITKFTATCGSKSASGKASPLVVKGLTAGKSYTCTVTATNSRGTGQATTTNAVKA